MKKGEYYLSLFAPVASDAEKRTFMGFFFSADDKRGMTTV